MKALYHHNRKDLPFGTDLNIYTGCSHGCIYCYARARFAERKNVPCRDFEKSKPRKGIAEALDRELFAIRKNGDPLPSINIGGSCDSYQAAEKENQTMRDVLEIMIRHRAPVVMSTKSDLILRDLDLIDRLAAASYAVISVTITSSSPEISRRIEPGAPLPDARANALAGISRTGAATGLHFFPVIPLLCDNNETVEWITETASSSGCGYIMPAFLYLRGGIREMFMREIRNACPRLEGEFRKIYRKGSADSERKKNFYSIFYRLAENRGLCTDYRKFLPPRTAERGTGQLSLF